jgi:hypothetical protein
MEGKGGKTAQAERAKLSRKAQEDFLTEVFSVLARQFLVQCFKSGKYFPEFG